MGLVIIFLFALLAIMAIMFVIFLLAGGIGALIIFVIAVWVIILGKFKASDKKMDETSKRIDEIETKLIPNNSSKLTKICPQCAQNIEAEAKLCGFCRYQFRQLP